MWDLGPGCHGGAGCGSSPPRTNPRRSSAATPGPSLLGSCGLPARWPAGGDGRHRPSRPDRALGLPRAGSSDLEVSRAGLSGPPRFAERVRACGFPPRRGRAGHGRRRRHRPGLGPGHRLAARAPLSHGDEVTTVAVHPDGGMKARSELEATFNVRAVLDVAVSPDGGLIATASSSGTVRLWNAQRTAVRPAPCASASVTSVAFRPDGRVLLTTSLDHWARHWDLATGAPWASPVWDRFMYTDTRYSPDGRRSRPRPAMSRFWDAATGKPVGPLLQHDKNAAGVAFHPGGRLLFTCGFDLILRAGMSRRPSWEMSSSRPLDRGPHLWRLALTARAAGPRRPGPAAAPRNVSTGWAAPARALKGCARSPGGEVS